MYVISLVRLLSLFVPRSPVLDSADDVSDLVGCDQDSGEGRRGQQGLTFPPGEVSKTEKSDNNYLS